MESDLKFLFKLQDELQTKVGNFPLVDDVQRQKFINMHSLALVDEVFEALRETPFKDWKKNQSYNEDKFKEELVDAWHFLINLSLASGMSGEELFSRFVNKNKVNIERQDKGY